MKLVLLSISLFFACFLGELVAQTNCKHIIPPDQSDVDGGSIAPGDTVCLLTGQKNYLYLNHLTGTASQPIVIINNGGEVKIETNHFFGIKFSHCQYVKLLGNGQLNTTYGIRVLKVENGAGISVDEMSKEIEIAFVEVSNTKVGGIYAKTDPDCTFAATREKFTLTGLSIHHCYIHDIADEGMYIGSSKYTGQHLTDCDTVVLPHLINNVRIFDNIVEHTGWDGIQVSSSPVDCFIYNNTIRNDSYRETPNQMSGILIGGGSDCDCYNNQIFDGKGDGIDVFGFGEMKLYNNLIVRSGLTFQPDVSTIYRHGIFIGNAPDSAAGRLKIMHNTIIAPKSTGIRFFNSFTNNNLVFNNIISTPGAYPTMGSSSYLNTDGSDAPIMSKQNIFTEQPETIGFVSLNNDDYDLVAGSRAVNAGFNAGLNNVSFDILNRQRPHNGVSDIGAFESQAINAGISTNDYNEFIRIIPNPSDGRMWIHFQLTETGNFYVQVFDMEGRQVTESIQLSNTFIDPVIELDLNHLHTGIYLLLLTTSRNTSQKKFVIN